MSDYISNKESSWGNAQYVSQELTMLFMKADELRIQINMRSNDAIEPYFAVLDSIYTILAPMIDIPDIQQKFKDYFTVCRQEIDRFIYFSQLNENMDYQRDIGDALREIHQELQYSRQKLGLAFPMVERHDAEKSKNRAMGL